MRTAATDSSNGKPITDYLSEYDPDWPNRFRQIAQHLRPFLPHGYRIEHVGSTSVAGMVAKPIIDIDVIVPDGEMPTAIACLLRAGYEHQGDLGLTGREAFRSATDSVKALPVHHLYACEAASGELRKHLSFRDYLRAHPQEASRLSAWKRHLAAELGLSRSEYIEAKEPVVTEIAAAALAWYSAPGKP